MPITPRVVYSPWACNTATDHLGGASNLGASKAAGNTRDFTPSTFKVGKQKEQKMIYWYVLGY